MNCRALVAMGLLVLLFVELLPCTLNDEPTTATRGGALSLRFEPLQVCDRGDSVFGGLANIHVLVPAAPSIFHPADLVRLGYEKTLRPLEGVKPGIDKPPRLLA